MKIRKLFTMRVMILLFFILISLLAIKPTTDTEGVAIRSIDTNSSAAFAGMAIGQNVQPTDYERILEINNNKIISLDDYSKFINTNAETITIVTDKGTYTLLNENIGLTVDEPATTNILRGLELQGGTRALIQPKEKITEQQYQDLIDTMENRLNVYGIKQLVLKRASDFDGNQYIIVEIAGATKEEVKELIGKQGNFEAKIGDEVVFNGGEKDITFVCRNDGTCSGIRSCNAYQGGYTCQFEFQITFRIPFY